MALHVGQRLHQPVHPDVPAGAARSRGWRRGVSGDMLTLIDRSLVRSYLKAYAVCLVSLLSLYVVVDLFTNLDDFAHTGGFGSTLRLIGSYYGVKIWQIFDRLCEAILVLAATFTIAWMRRNNEQIPLLSSGVSTQRIVRPVLLSASVLM